jgi:hypothetical protein
MRDYESGTEIVLVRDWIVTAQQESALKPMRCIGGGSTQLIHGLGTEC